MAIDTTNIKAAIAAKIAGEDSAVTALELLQYGVGLSEYGAAQYYTSADSLPTADNDLKGMIALVYTGDLTSGNGLYLCTGTEWFEMQDLDSAAPGAAPYSFQGSNFGYTSTGGTGPLLAVTNTIDKFPFAADANATDVGDVSVAARYGISAQSSTTHGYTTGGTAPSVPGTLDVIDKFPFAADASASDVGNLLSINRYSTGQSSENNGYVSGNNPADANVIQKFPFATDANATDVGDLLASNNRGSGQNSSSHGYNSGGADPAIINTIQKFSFATDANATDVGDLTVAKFYLAGQSSTISGYISGGRNPPANYNVIEKFPFASDTNSSDVGDLTQGRYGNAGQSSTTSGYNSGGAAPAVSNVIDKFPFSSDTNATDVGDLTVARGGAAGQQY